MAYPRKPRADAIFINAYLADISTAGQIYVVPGFAGKIVRITSVINNAITTADGVLTAKIGGTAVTNGGITITQSGSASGDVDECLPTALNTFTGSQAVEIETTGACDTTCATMITLECVPI